MLDDSLHPGPRFRSVIRRPFIEDGAHSFTIESQTETVLLRKLPDLCLSIFHFLWPQTFQVLFVNNTVFPFAMHVAFDLFRERFHRFTTLVVDRIGLMLDGVLLEIF